MSANPLQATVHSRRQFLKSSALAAGTLAAASQLHVHAAGGDLIRVGLIGCGGRGTEAASNALKADPNTKLVALGDAFPAKIAKALKNLDEYGSRIDVPPERRFTGFDAYKGVIESVDVVLLCTPPGFRPAHLRA